MRTLDKKPAPDRRVRARTKAGALLFGVAIVLLALVGLRLFGWIGMGCGDTGIAGDAVRFGTAPTALRLLKGKPERRERLGDTPRFLWRYENQTAFGRACALEYTVYEESASCERLLANGVTGVTAEIPVADAGDAEAVFEAVYAALYRACADRGDSFSHVETRAPGEDVPVRALLSVSFGATGQSVTLRRNAQSVSATVEYTC